MKFTFTGKKVNLSNRVQSYAEKKVGKLERYFKTEPEASLVFSVEKDRNKVELTIRSGGMVLRVAESTSDLFLLCIFLPCACRFEAIRFSTLR